MDATAQQRPPMPMGMAHAQAHAHALPSIASLTSTLSPMEQNPPGRPNRQHPDATEARDSGNWSVPQSKHSSGDPTMGLPLTSILNPGDSPSRNSIPDTPSSARYPSHQSNTLPSLNQGFDNRLSIDSSQFDSRRSSVDSRMNAGMNHLAISPSSPYESQNASHVSLISNLQQQRGITNEQRPNGASPLSPRGPRVGPRISNPPRRAPVINPNPRNVSGQPDPMAAAPTKGFPWAFPADPDPIDRLDRRESSSGDSSIGGHHISRQNSFAPSIGSSIFTTDSNLPNGQRLLGEDDITSTHHHSMQHRNVTSLQSPDQASTPGSGNYSRTPELRVSHKIAERKRRSEMKGLFEQLNAILPNSPGSKSSKWEILTKSIDYIKSLNRAHENTRNEVARLRTESEYGRRVRDENEHLRTELHVVWNHLRRADPNSPHVYGNMTSVFAQQQGPSPTAPNTLPPLQQAQQQQQQAQQQPQSQQWGGPPAQSAMQGVEFGGMRPYEHPHR